MKKLLPIITLLLGFSLYMGAQNLSVFDLNGNNITGDTIDVFADVTVNEVIEEMKVKNNTSMNLNLKFKKNYITIISGSDNNMCVGENCFPEFVMESTEFIVMANMLSTEPASCHYLPDGNVGTSTIMYTFYNVDNATDSASVVVNFNIGNVSIDEVANIKTSVYPNPATNMVNFEYNIDNVNDSWFEVYNMLGNKVKDIHLDQSSGIINVPVDELEAGIYFYSVVVNGEAVETERLVIR